MPGRVTFVFFGFFRDMVTEGEKEVRSGMIDAIFKAEKYVSGPIAEFLSFITGGI
jgi:hypothetical protein